jgi:hypothetical protein
MATFGNPIFFRNPTLEAGDRGNLERVPERVERPWNAEHGKRLGAHEVRFAMVTKWAMPIWTLPT